MEFLLLIEAASHHNRERQLQKTTALWNAQKPDSGALPQEIHLQHNSCTQGSGKTWKRRQEDQEICTEGVSPRNDPEVSLPYLSYTDAQIRPEHGTKKLLPAPLGEFGRQHELWIKWTWKCWTSQLRRVTHVVTAAGGVLHGFLCGVIQAQGAGSFRSQEQVGSPEKGWS